MLAMRRLLGSDPNRMVSVVEERAENNKQGPQLQGLRLSFFRRQFHDSRPRPLFFHTGLTPQVYGTVPIHVTLEVRGGTQDDYRQRYFRAHTPGTRVHSASPSFNGLSPSRSFPPTFTRILNMVRLRSAGPCRMRQLATGFFSRPTALTTMPCSHRRSTRRRQPDCSPPWLNQLPAVLPVLGAMEGARSVMIDGHFLVLSGACRRSRRKEKF